VVAGTGSEKYVKFFKKLEKRHKGKFAYEPSFNRITSLVYAGSDMFMMPSRYEPCGLSQLISIRYGSIPIVHETGGLSDTIANFNPRTGKGIGFVFSAFTREAFLMTVARALETYKYPRVWEHLTWQAMRMSYSWELPAKKYLNLYRRAIEKRKSWK
jgi:starch synthase